MSDNIDSQAGHNLQEELTQDLEKNTEGITLSTIHGVKGLEFDQHLLFSQKNSV
ncbi:14779_t:CDS:2 [Entrophospora sp. SA101]|nr:14779_t:CDS:2 [Entrophospora sp. SA101]